MEEGLSAVCTAGRLGVVVSQFGGVLLVAWRRLPQLGRLDDFLDELFKGARHPLPGLGAGLDEHHLVLPGAFQALLLAHNPFTVAFKITL